MRTRRTFLIVSQVYVPDPAAIGQHLADVAKELVRRGHRVSVYTANREARIESGLALVNYRVPSYLRFGIHTARPPLVDTSSIREMTASQSPGPYHQETATGTQRDLVAEGPSA